MREQGTGWVHPELKELVGEASCALARLDADRLEELALSCRRLNRELEPGDLSLLAVQAREAKAGMAVFGRVLEATRANMQVMNRLRELRQNRLEYTQNGWARLERPHGDN